MSLNVFPTYSAAQLGQLFSGLGTGDGAQISLSGKPATPPPPPAPKVEPTQATLPALRKPASVAAQALARQCLNRRVFSAAHVAQAASLHTLVGSDFIACMANSTLDAMEGEMFFERLAEVIAMVCDGHTLERARVLTHTEAGALIDDIAVTIAAGIAHVCSAPFVASEEGDFSRAYMARLFDVRPDMPPAAEGDGPRRWNSGAFAADAAECCVRLLAPDLEGPARQAAIDAVTARFSPPQLRTVHALLRSPFGRRLCAARREVALWVEAAFGEPELRDAIETRMARLVVGRVMEVAKADPPPPDDSQPMMAAALEQLATLAQNALDGLHDAPTK
jgi:hypothetical protein